MFDYDLALSTDFIIGSFVVLVALLDFPCDLARGFYSRDARPEAIEPTSVIFYSAGQLPPSPLSGITGFLVR